MFFKNCLSISAVAGLNILGGGGTARAPKALASRGSGGKSPPGDFYI